jgi:hypothetical protein
MTILITIRPLVHKGFEELGRLPETATPRSRRLLRRGVRSSVGHRARRSRGRLAVPAVSWAESWAIMSSLFSSPTRLVGDRANERVEPGQDPLVLGRRGRRQHRGRGYVAGDREGLDLEQLAVEVVRGRACFDSLAGGGDAMRA